MGSGQPQKTPTLKVSLSTLLLLMAIVALAFGWYADRRLLRQELLEARKRLQLLETSQFFDGDSDVNR